MKSKKLFLAILLTFTAFWLNCSNNSPTASGGNASDVGNALVSGRLINTSGDAVANASVKLFPADYNPVDNTSHTGTAVDSTTSDDQGHYSFGRLKPGVYNVIAEKEGRLSYQDNIDAIADSSRIISTSTLKEPGSIGGVTRVVNYSDNRNIDIIALGTDKFTQTEDTIGNFHFARLPEGQFKVLIRSRMFSDAIYDTMFAIQSGQNIILTDTIGIMRAMGDNKVFQIIIAPDGTKWMMKYHGEFVKFDGNQWSSIFVRDFWAWQNHGACLDHNGYLWYMSNDSLYQFNLSDHVLIAHPAPDLDFVFSLNDRAITSDLNNNIWISCFKGVMKYSNNQWTYFGKSDGVPIGSPQDANCVVVDKNNNVWGCASGGGLFKYDGNVWRSFTTADGLFSNAISDIKIDDSGTVWCGTVKGVSSFSGSLWKSYDTSDGLISNCVNAVAIDSSGDCWFGTQNGLSRFNGQTWENYNEKNGLISNQISDLAADKDGSLWISTRFGVSKIMAGQITNYSNPGISGKLITQFHIDSKDNLWFLTDYQALTFNGYTWKTVQSPTTNYGYTGSNRYQLFEDREGNIWFRAGYASSIFKYSNGVTTEYPFCKHFPWKVFIVQSPDGTIMVGGPLIDSVGANEKGGVLYKYKNDQWGNPTYFDYPIYDAVFENENRIWIAFDNGLIKYEAGAETTFTIFDTLPQAYDGHEKVIIDRNMDIWISHWYGIYKFDRRNWTYFNPTTINPNGSPDVKWCSGLYKDSTGNIWAGFINWVAKYDGNGWTAYDHLNGYPGGGLLADFKVDSKNNVWLINNGGIHRINQSGIVTYPYTAIFNNQYYTWNGTSNKFICEDSQGNIWMSVGGYGVAKWDSSVWKIFYQSEH